LVQSILAWRRYFSHLQIVQTGSGAHSVSSSIGIWVLSRE
jgi:hypothetical protein